MNSSAMREQLCIQLNSLVDKVGGLSVRVRNGTLVGGRPLRQITKVLGLIATGSTRPDREAGKGRNARSRVLRSQKGFRRLNSRSLGWHSTMTAGAGLCESDHIAGYPSGSWRHLAQIGSIAPLTTLFPRRFSRM